MTATRRGRQVVASLLAVVTGAVLVLVATVLAPVRHPAATAAATPAPRAGITGSIATLQAHLLAQPRDAQGWAELGFGYVQQARVTGDPSYYPKAQGALERARQIGATGGAKADVTADAGFAALAGARHDFSGALAWADRALALDPQSAPAAAARVDALTELGRYDEALAAAKALDAVQPSIASFTRLSYQAELRGDVAEARRLLELALPTASAPADVAYVRHYLGELAFGNGDLAGALVHFRGALAADPTYLASRAGVARTEAALGRTSDALRDYAAVVAALPLPQYVEELIDLDTALGRRADAAAQTQLLRSEVALLRASGVDGDLELAVFEADHGDARTAVALASAEWRRRHAIPVADALGWALHAAGEDRAALTMATQATALGARDARVLAHRGLIEASLGLTAAARTHLSEALRISPHFSPVLAPRAARVLARLSD